MTWQFTLTGLLIGVLVGLTGMGGGSRKWPVKMPERPLRLALAGALGLSGIKLLNVPGASWILASGLGLGAAALAAWAVDAWLNRPRAIPARSLE